MLNWRAICAAAISSKQARHSLVLTMIIRDADFAEGSVGRCDGPPGFVYRRLRRDLMFDRVQYPKMFHVTSRAVSRTLWYECYVPDFGRTNTQTEGQTVELATYDTQG